MEASLIYFVRESPLLLFPIPIPHRMQNLLVSKTDWTQIIFSFYLTLFAGIARMKSGLMQKLTFRSMMGLRIAWPLIAFFFLVCIDTSALRGNRN